jgi:hypothetical protein
MPKDGASIGALSPSVLVRAEGAAVLGLALYLYGRYGRGWILFAVLILVPDISIPVYFLDRRLGAAVYNLVHTLLWPAALAGFGVGADNRVAVAVALIWFAHIGADRMLGYGLKYPADFKQTHIQRL